MTAPLLPGTLAFNRCHLIGVKSNPTQEERMNSVPVARQALKVHMKGILRGATWSTAFTPTMECLQPLSHLVPYELRKAILEPPVGVTEFEKAMGKPLCFLTERNTDAITDCSMEAKAALFDTLVLPASQKPVTRWGNYGAWRSYVTYMASEGKLEDTMPSSVVSMKAWAIHLLMCGYAGASLERFFEAIIDRHRQYHVDTVVPTKEIRSWVETLQKGVGVPKREKFPILHVHLKCLMELRMPDDSIVTLRDTAAIVLGTVCALRLAELLRLDVCDFLWDEDGEWTLALLVWLRKNDAMKRGLNPRVGRGSHPSTCPIELLKAYQKAAGLWKHPECTKNIWKRSPCEKCGKFFRATTAGGKRVRATSDPKHGMSRDAVGTAVKTQLKRIGVVPDKFSPISMRKGGVSTALSGGVSQELRALQSGHRSISWQNYADIVKPEQLYDFFHSFGL